MAPGDEVGDRNDMVWVEGKGYVRKGKAHAYQALGLVVRWDTAEPDPDATARLPYKDD